MDRLTINLLSALETVSWTSNINLVTSRFNILNTLTAVHLYRSVTVGCVSCRPRWTSGFSPLRPNRYVHVHLLWIWIRFKKERKIGSGFLISSVASIAWATGFGCQNSFNYMLHHLIVYFIRFRSDLLPRPPPPPSSPPSTPQISGTDWPQICTESASL